MDFLRRFFPRTKAKSFDSAQWTTIYPSDVAERNLLANNKEWVFIATDKVAKAVSAVRFKVMKYTRDGDDQEVFEGPLVDFLEAPTAELTGKDFIYLDVAHKELTGNAFWEIKSGRRLEPLIPTNVRPVIKGGKLLGYKYQEPTGDRVIERSIPAEKMLHDRYIDPRKPWWGVGKLEKIARWVDTSSYANEFLRVFFINGAQFGGFIETEEESEERIKLIKAGLQNEHVGVENAHKMAVLPKGSKFAAATSNMHDMQYTELDDKYRDKILSAFGIPKALVGLAEQVQRGNVEASEYIFSKYTVKPIVDDFVEFLNFKVVPLFDDSGAYYIAYDEFIPENTEAKFKERELALNKQPYKTVNEVRAEEGLPPVPSGDTIYTGQGMELGEKPAAPVQPAGPEPKKAMPRHYRRQLGRHRLADELATRVAEIASQHHDPDEAAHREFVGRVEAHEERLAQKVRDFNGRQQREVMENITRMTKAIAKGDLFDMDGEVSILVDFVSPLLKGLMVEQAIAEFEAQGFEGSLETEGHAFTKAVEIAARRMARSYNDTTARLLQDALNTGIQAGDDLRQLSERVRAIYDYSDTHRAAAVARTESFYIANEASRQAYKQSGVVKTVRWYTAEDERVCPFCGPQNGKIIGVNEVFFRKGETVTGVNEKGDTVTMNTNYRAIDVPPLHTNCRCFIRPEGIDIA